MGFEGWLVRHAVRVDGHDDRPGLANCCGCASTDTERIERPARGDDDLLGNSMNRRSETDLPAKLGNGNVPPAVRSGEPLKDAIDVQHWKTIFRPLVPTGSGAAIPDPAS